MDIRPESIKWERLSESNIPEREISPMFFNGRYSKLVLVANEITGQVWEASVRYDYEGCGWVDGLFSDGPDPEDYEMMHVTHWAYWPTFECDKAE